MEAHVLKTISVPGFDPRSRGSGSASESRLGTMLKNFFKNGQTKSEISCLEAVCENRTAWIAHSALIFGGWIRT
jgi:hypothetical protein